MILLNLLIFALIMLINDYVSFVLFCINMKYFVLYILIIIQNCGFYINKFEFEFEFEFDW